MTFALNTTAAAVAGRFYRTSGGRSRPDANHCVRPCKYPGAVGQAMAVPGRRWTVYDRTGTSTRPYPTELGQSLTVQYNLYPAVPDGSGTVFDRTRPYHIKRLGASIYPVFAANLSQ